MGHTYMIQAKINPKKNLWVTNSVTNRSLPNIFKYVKLIWKIKTDKREKPLVFVIFVV